MLQGSPRTYLRIIQEQRDYSKQFSLFIHTNIEIELLINVLARCGSSELVV